MDLQNHHQEKNTFIVLNPLVIYSSVTFTYFFPSFISGIYFDDIPFLFLSKEARDSDILFKGLLIVVSSLISCSVGFVLFPKSFVKTKSTSLSFYSGGSLLILSAVGIFIGIIIYGPQRYFFAGYALNESDSVSWVIGNNIVYFCGEILIALSLSVRLIDEKKIYKLDYLVVLSLLLLLLFRLKRLEAVTAILSITTLYVCLFNISVKKIVLIILVLLIIISLIGGLRQGLDEYDPILTILSIALEANYTCNSFYGTIYLIDIQGYDYTYGKDLLAIPIQSIPTFILPFKQEIIDTLVNKNWSNSYVLNPLGAFFGLANIYKQGGIYMIVVFNFTLGLIFKYTFVKFKYSLINNVKSFYIYFYPIMIYSFVFHFTRDDINVAFKMIFQCILLYYIIVLLKSASLNIFSIRNKSF